LRHVISEREILSKLFLEYLMTTIYDVSKRAGVSTATVSRVVNNNPKVDARLREQVLTAMEELRYVPNGSARSLVTKQTRRIALIISDITNPFFAQTARGAQDALDERGYQLLLANSDDRPARELRYLSTFAETGVDGVLIEPAMPDNRSAAGQRGVRRALAHHLENLSLPVVALSPDHVMPNADTVSIDEEAAAFKAVDHLLGLGHRQIAMINGPQHSAVGTRRAAGYRRALERHGIAWKSELVVHTHFRRDAGREAMQGLLSRFPEISAVFGADGPLASGALQAARDVNRRVPQELAVVCVGDSVMSAENDPPLTVVAHPRGYEFGRVGSQLLLERILKTDAEPLLSRRVVLETRLIVRASTVLGIDSEA
jgi:LacI family transcriptional regulator